jgi:hypothetical protein
MRAFDHSRGRACVAWAAVHVRTARTHHAEAPEIVASAHCVKRFRERMPIRTPGGAAVEEALVAALESADITHWPPGWAVSDRPAELWAIAGDLAFPLARTPQRGRWLAVTCLKRG